MGEAMATGVVTGEGVHGIPFDELHRMTVNEYERLAESGILDDPQVELINGLLVKKMTKKPRHVSACEPVAGALEALLPEGWYIREQNPLRIPDYDEPEPNIVIARGSRGRYATRHPGPGDVALVVEVADTSLGKDRGEKSLAYGRGGVPVYWIVNLIDNQIEVYSKPDRNSGDYARCVVHAASDSVPLEIENAEAGRVAVSDVLPGETP
jgi:Uma2 family endonuclease